MTTSYLRVYGRSVIDVSECNSSVNCISRFVTISLCRRVKNESRALQTVRAKSIKFYLSFYIVRSNDILKIKATLNLLFNKRNDDTKRLLILSCGHSMTTNKCAILYYIHTRMDWLFLCTTFLKAPLYYFLVFFENIFQISPECHRGAHFSIFNLVSEGEGTWYFPFFSFFQQSLWTVSQFCFIQFFQIPP